MIQWIVSSSVLILAVVALRALFGKRLRPGLRYALWAVVLLRLLIPGTVFSGAWSVASAVRSVRERPLVEAAETAVSYGTLPRMSYAEARERVAEEYAGRGVDVDELPIAQYGETVAYEIEAARRGSVTWKDLLRRAWLAGCAVTACVFLIQNLSLYRRLRRCRVRIGTERRLPVWAVEGLGSSCLFGRGIYVDDATAGDGERLRHVLAHELSHWRHGDALWALLRCLALALHWYNPLVWLAARLSRRDAELCADAGALAELGEQTREAYGDTLIRLAAGYAPRVSLLSAATTMTGGKRELKERIAMIAKKRSTPILLAVLVVALAAVAVACSVTGAERKPEATKPPEPTLAASASDLEPQKPVETDGQGGGAIPIPNETPTPKPVPLGESADGDFVPVSVTVVNMVSSVAPLAHSDSATVEELYALYRGFQIGDKAGPDAETLRGCASLIVSFTGEDGTIVSFRLWGPYLAVMKQLSDDEYTFEFRELEDGDAIYRAFYEATGRWTDGEGGFPDELLAALRALHDGGAIADLPMLCDQVLEKARYLDWSALDSEQFSLVADALRAAAVGDDQQGRDLRMMLAALRTDGAYAELFFDDGGLLCLQSQADPLAYSLAMVSLSPDAREQIERASALWETPGGLRDTDMARVRDFLPECVVALRYATEDNFTGRRIYDFSEAYLRYGTVKKLLEVELALEEEGLRLLIWDAYRPGAAQRALWEAVPDPRYVADPYTGYSIHSCGSAVDLTIADRDGKPLPMPTGFDDFSALADRDYADVTDPAARANAEKLEALMQRSGFAAYAGEWWHFTDTDEYGLIEFAP